jgi:hypothetical protein
MSQHGTDHEQDLEHTAIILASARTAEVERGNGKTPRGGAVTGCALLIKSIRVSSDLLSRSSIDSKTLKGQERYCNLRNTTRKYE